uniref:T cell receptor, alpha n=1 Tax=Bos taurus TaxID=9913 RepID=Q3SZN6_BOVIN|nr:T cell receptor, alpha [Bos taurus]
MRLVTVVTVFLTLGTVVDAKTTQPNSMDCAEGENVNLPCNHSIIRGEDYIHWYRQNPSQSPQYVIHGLRGTVNNSMASLHIASDRKSSTLVLPQVTLRDAAVYYCTPSSSSGWQLTFGSGTQLTVVPEVKDPNPTVYQLRSPQSSDTSVCLFTDFDSNQVNMEKIMGSEGSTVHKTNSTVLNMEILGSKSNGIVTWGNTSDAGCEYTFNETIPFASSLEISCNAKLVEKSFETDINLNSQNLSVIVFRILLLKVVGFNLLMTLRLWSS